MYLRIEFENRVQNQILTMFVILNQVTLFSIIVLQ